MNEKGGCATGDDNSQRQRQPWSTVPEAPFPGGTELKSVPGLNSIESVIRFAVSNQTRHRAKTSKHDSYSAWGVKGLASLNAPDCNPPHRRCRTEIVVLWSPWGSPMTRCKSIKLVLVYSPRARQFNCDRFRVVFEPIGNMSHDAGRIQFCLIVVPHLG